MLINDKNPHGGQVYGHDIDLDFSVNINPCGAHSFVLEAARKAVDLSYMYPDASCSELRQAAAKKEGVPEKNIICGNGGAELIFQLTEAIKPRKALIIEPTFCEYRQAVEAAGGVAETFMLGKDFDFDIMADEISRRIEKGTDMVFVCNPNNPTGKVTGRKSIEKLLDACTRLQALLVVDESFGELTEGYDEFSAVDLTLKSKHIFVLKSLTKTYAIPGIRAGYGICSDERLLDNMCSKVQCWNLSVIAQKAASAALLLDDAYLKETLDILRKEREYLTGKLMSLGIKVIESRTNFMLIEAYENLKSRLQKERILIRSCDNFTGLDSRYFRIAVKKHEENVRLVKALEKLKKEESLCTEQV